MGHTLCRWVPWRPDVRRCWLCSSVNPAFLLFALQTDGAEKQEAGLPAHWRQRGTRPSGRRTVVTALQRRHCPLKKSKHPLVCYCWNKPAHCWHHRVSLRTPKTSTARTNSAFHELLNTWLKHDCSLNVLSHSSTQWFTTDGNVSCLSVTLSQAMCPLSVTLISNMLHSPLTLTILALCPTTWRGRKYTLNLCNATLPSPPIPAYF